MNLLLFKLFFKSLKKFKNRNKIKRFKNRNETKYLNKTFKKKGA